MTRDISGDPARLDYTEKIIMALRYLSHVSSIYSKYLEKEIKVTTGQLLCLRALYKETFLTPSEIGKRIFLKPGTLTGMVDRLEAKQLLKRVRSEKDRRAIILEITPAGRAVVEAAPTPIQSLVALNIKKLPMAEIETISNGLENLLELFQKMELPPQVDLEKIADEAI